MMDHTLDDDEVPHLVDLSMPPEIMPTREVKSGFRTNCHEVVVHADRTQLLQLIALTEQRALLAERQLAAAQGAAAALEKQLAAVRSELVAERLEVLRLGQLHREIGALYRGLLAENFRLRLRLAGDGETTVVDVPLPSGGIS